MAALEPARKILEILEFKLLQLLVCSLLGEDRKGSSRSGWDEGNGSVLHLHFSGLHTAGKMAKAGK